MDSALSRLSGDERWTLDTPALSSSPTTAPFGHPAIQLSTINPLSHGAITPTALIVSTLYPLINLRLPSSQRYAMWRQGEAPMEVEEKGQSLGQPSTPPTPTSLPSAASSAAHGVESRVTLTALICARPSVSATSLLVHCPLFLDFHHFVSYGARLLNLTQVYDVGVDEFLYRGKEESWRAWMRSLLAAVEVSKPTAGTSPSSPHTTVIGRHITFFTAPPPPALDDTYITPLFTVASGDEGGGSQDQGITSRGLLWEANSSTLRWDTPPSPHSPFHPAHPSPSSPSTSFPRSSPSAPPPSEPHPFHVQLSLKREMLSEDLRAQAGEQEWLTLRFKVEAVNQSDRRRRLHSPFSFDKHIIGHRAASMFFGAWDHRPRLNLLLQQPSTSGQLFSEPTPASLARRAPFLDEQALHRREVN